MKRWLAVAVVVVVAAATGLVVWLVTRDGAPAAAPVAASAMAVPGRGATVPFTEYEAEAAVTNGQRIGPERHFGTLAGEASGRMAVTLAPGQYVEFTLRAAANAVDVRFSLPDSATGADRSAPLHVSVDGTALPDLTLTTRYSWFYGGFPFTNNPADAIPRHLYDDVHALLGKELSPGAKVRLIATAGSTVDFADFEKVPPPLTAPAGALSVLDFGADPAGTRDSSAAFAQAVAAGRAQGKPVFIPAGTFLVPKHLAVDQVTLTGAGMWYSALTGAGVGIYGNFAPHQSTNVHLADFAILGDTVDRDDAAQVNGVGGALGGGSVVRNLWIEHTKVGLWLDGPFDGLLVTGCRIQNLTADGINLHQGISHVQVVNNVVRNTGDDGLAMWSEYLPGGKGADHDNVFAFNTVQYPMLANNIAIYGGSDNVVSDNVVADTQVEGGGIHVGNRFSAEPLAGTTLITRNTALRTGADHPALATTIGALWFYPKDFPMTGTITVTDNDLLDSSYAAVQFFGTSVTNVSFTGLHIDGAGTYAMQVQANGGIRLADSEAVHVGHEGRFLCTEANTFGFESTGSTGFDTTYCGPFPQPVYAFDGVVPSHQPAATPSFSPGPGPVPAGSAAPHGGDLAAGRPVTGSSEVNAGQGAANAVDGDPDTYWESANNAFPQTLTVDLGSATTVTSVVLKLPPAAAWQARSQTVAVAGSSDGSSFAGVVGAKAYAFDPATGNSVIITVPATSLRYLRLTFTANTGWPAAQVASVEVYH